MKRLDSACRAGTGGTDWVKVKRKGALLAERFKRPRARYDP